MAKSGALQRWKDKCFSDFDFCMRKAPFKLVTAAKGQFGLCTMSMGDWPIQQALHRETERQLSERGFVRIIICKSRKRGCSSWIQAKSKHVEISVPGTMSLTVAHESAATETIFRIGKTIAENINPKLAQVKGKPKGKRIEWQNGSYSVCATQGGSVDSFRGWTPTFLHISELPSWETNRKDSSAVEVAQALLNAVPDVPGTYVYIESTALGVGNLFHRMYLDAEKGLGGQFGFVPMFFPWSIDSDCSLPAATRHIDKGEQVLWDSAKDDWESGDKQGFHEKCDTLGWSQVQRDRALQFGLDPKQVRFWQHMLVNKCGNDQDRFDQEWPLSSELAFVTSGRNVFSAAQLKRRKEWLTNNLNPIRGQFDDDCKFTIGKGGWEVYEQPKKGEQYIVTADVAGGGMTKDDDFSAIQVLKRRDRVQVAEFKARIHPDHLAHQIASAFRFYKAYMAAPENNGPGLLVIHVLMRKYPDVRLYRRYMRAGEVTGSPSNAVGYTTDARTRPYMMGLLESGVRNSTIVINSTRLIDELTDLVRTKTGRIEHQSGGFDDAAVAMAISLDLDQLFVEQGIESYKPVSPTTYGYPEDGGIPGGVHSVFSEAVDNIDIPDSTYDVDFDGWN
jgi:hypothetical protein